MLPPGRKPLGDPPQIPEYSTVVYPNVNRVEVIDENGRSYVKYNANNVQIQIQDDGRTMKVFLKREKM